MIHYITCRRPDEAVHRPPLSTGEVVVTTFCRSCGASAEHIADRDDVDDDQPEPRHVGWVVHVPQPYVEPHTRCIFRGWRPRGGRRR
jgi:hypothetical protein